MDKESPDDVVISLPPDAFVGGPSVTPPAGPVSSSAAFPEPLASKEAAPAPVERGSQHEAPSEVSPPPALHQASPTGAPAAAANPESTLASSSGAGDLAALQTTISAANKSTLWPLRWAFLLTLIPLVWYTFRGKTPELDPQAIREAFGRKLEERAGSNPQLRDSIDKMKDGKTSLETISLWAAAFEDQKFSQACAEIKKSLDEIKKDEKVQLLALLELELMKKHSGLLPLPFLAEDTWGHWLLGAGFAVVFMLYFCFAYPRGNASQGQLLLVGLFTGTIGVLLLLVIQWLSTVATMFRLRGRGILVLIWFILVAIAFSYSAADNPNFGFWLSFLGFTLGVGLLEELCKLLPIVWHYRTDGSLSWRGACVLGLVSGAGFGISEGIMYSSRYYNGSETVGIYIVRFVSCVAMHAVWAGASAILTYRRREYLQGEFEWTDYFKALGPVILLPMILHGLYDTLLKMNMTSWALLVGAISFVFFVVVQEWESRSQASQAKQLIGLSG